MKKPLQIVSILMLVCVLLLAACSEEAQPPAGNIECQHNFGEWITTKEATCMEEGEAKRICSLCSDEEKKTIQKTILHTEVTDQAVASTCTANGKSEGIHCSVCGLVIVQQISLPLVNHSYDNDYDKTCNKCDFVRDINCAHTETTTLQAIAPTCTAQGLTEGEKCSTCDEILIAQTTIDALGHNEATDKAVAPTCAATGLTEGKHCDRCSKTLVAQVSVAALGHNEIIMDAVAPTCTATGLTEGRYCDRCSEIVVAQVTIDALGHSEVIINTVAPTCTDIGFTDYKVCSACDLILSERTIVSALGHTYANNTCSVCSHTIIPSSGLTFSLLSDGTYAVTGLGTCTDLRIVIPANYEGKNVSQISANAFRSLNKTGIYIPSTITSIGVSAFEGASLSYVYMEEGVSRVGSRAFASNYGSIHLMVVPSTIEYIGSMAFMCGSKCVVLNSETVAKDAYVYDAVGYLLFHAQSVLIRDGMKYGSYVGSGRREYMEEVHFMGNKYISFSTCQLHSPQNYSAFGWKGLRCSSCGIVSDSK